MFVSIDYTHYVGIIWNNIINFSIIRPTLLFDLIETLEQIYILLL